MQYGSKKNAVIIIPFYKETVSIYAEIALQQCFKVLGNHDIVAIKPKRLNLPEAVTCYPFAEVVDFDDDFFKGIAGYNRLMMSDGFYERFLNYEFMLIYQTDAFVFTDQLDYWCNQGYDYIGAPWLKDSDHPDMVKKIKSGLQYYFHTRYDIRKNGEPTKYQWENRVGNGGFSLRRVAKFRQVCLDMKAEIDNYHTRDSYHFHEDRFWSVESNRKRKVLNIPNYKTGVKFAFELAPARALRLTGGQLPFGCHGWERQLEFWKPIIDQVGYHF